MKSDTITTRASGRRKHAREVLAAWDSNDWDGSDDIDVLADARYAVVVEREDDSWVLAADTPADIAGIELACLTGTEGYDEWVSTVFVLDTGDEIATRALVIVEVRIEGQDGVGRVTNAPEGRPA